LADTGAHMRGHEDVDAILRSVKDNWGKELRAAGVPPRHRAESASVRRQVPYGNTWPLSVRAGLAQSPQPRRPPALTGPRRRSWSDEFP
jgi:hypothetical protein